MMRLSIPILILLFCKYTILINQNYGLRGEVAYTGQVIYRMEQFTNTSGKPSMHLFGHTHGYSRGQSKDYKHMMVDVATAGGNIDYWGEYPNADYPQFSNTQDEYGFVVFEVTAGADPKITLKRFREAMKVLPKDNVLSDTFTIYKKFPKSSILQFLSFQLIKPFFWNVLNFELPTFPVGIRSNTDKPNGRSTQLMISLILNLTHGKILKIGITTPIQSKR